MNSEANKHSVISLLVIALFAGLLVFIFLTMLAHEARAEHSAPCNPLTIGGCNNNTITIRQYADSVAEIDRHKYARDEASLRAQGFGLNDYKFRREAVIGSGDTAIIVSGNNPNPLTNPLGIDTDSVVDRLIKQNAGR